ncbi:MAG: hypothetical protein RDV48_05380 [Candidatus Eremiobacteraeota bacterium]|nr:hypothetical protein [Candidatus Eremiobacteraeota bacterium]
MDFLKKILSHPKKEMSTLSPYTGEKAAMEKTPEKGLPPNDHAFELTDPLLMRIFLDFTGRTPPFSAILFDAEEEECFVYFFNESELVKAAALPLGEWPSRAETLKSLNEKTVTIGSSLFSAGTIISFSNFGERISLVLERVRQDCPSGLSDKKKATIKLLNLMKPATSLTELNKVHMACFIEKHLEGRSGSLADLLREEGLLTEALYEKCLALSKTGRPVEALFPEQGVFPRKALTRVIARWADYEYLDIDDEEIDENLADLMGIEFCRAHHLLPCRLTDDEVLVAAADPSLREPLQAVEEKIGKKAVAKMSAEEDIRELTEDLFKHMGSGE